MTREGIGRLVVQHLDRPFDETEERFAVGWAEIDLVAHRWALQARAYLLRRALSNAAEGALTLASELIPDVSSETCGSWSGDSVPAAAGEQVLRLPIFPGADLHQAQHRSEQVVVAGRLRRFAMQAVHVQQRVGLESA